MFLKDKIDNDYKKVLKAKDKAKISTFRLILSSIKDLEISNRSGPNKKVTDNEDIKKLLHVLNQLVDKGNKDPNQSKFIRKTIDKICQKLKKERCKC